MRTLREGKGDWAWPVPTGSSAARAARARAIMRMFDVLPPWHLLWRRVSSLGSFCQNAWCVRTATAVSIFQLSNSQSKSAPVFIRARGFARIPFSLPFPQARGMARRKAHCPDFAGRPGGSVRAVAHHTDAPASPDAPFAVSSAFAYYGGRTMRDRSPPHRLLRRPLGDGAANPARKYRIPPHSDDAS